MGRRYYTLRHGRREGLPFSGAAAPVVTLLSYGFTGAFLGNAGTLSLSYPGLNLTRASAATVQTSASTVVTSPTNDQARIGSTGAAWGQGLVIEEARTNGCLGARTIPTNWGGAGVGVTYTTGQTGPDGTTGAQRVQLAAAGQNSNFQDTSANGITIGAAAYWSQWARGTSVAQAHDFTMGNSGSAGNAFQVATTTSWQRFSSNAYASNAAANYFIPVDSEFFSNGACDVLLDFCQVELGKFPTEAIVTGAAAATRAGERLFITSAATVIDTNRMGLAFTFVAKAIPANYSAIAYLWFIDASNKAWIDVTQKLNVMLGGVTVTSAAAIAWAFGDVVDMWIACGAGSNAVVEYRTNGGVKTVLINTALAGNPSGAGNIDICCSGTSNQLSCWLQNLTAYKTGQQPSWA